MSVLGCDGLLPKVPLDLSKETRGKFVELLEKVEQSGRWPQQACAAMFFLIPKNVTSERPNSLLSDSMVGGAEREVKRRQERHRVGWDAV